MGLKSALEELATAHGGKTDSEVTETLLNRLSKKNYIPAKVRAVYGEAFLREFKKFAGKPYEEEVISGLDIKVLGPGCPQCDGLEQALMAVVSETRITANIEHVQDTKEIGRWGVMGTPALVINGRVKSVGKIPPKNRLIQWLKEANSKLA
ncbi:MAG: thioredoxin family protein [Deltaproteobacteria bacterium]|nr:thioredoxin family protein [Deltaproteobacteria bacterium]